jgi:hypothetical protein
LHGIATDVAKKFDELNIVAYDENGKDLKISSISVDKPYQKEFTTIFNKPIFKGDKARYYLWNMMWRNLKNISKIHF